MTDAKGKNTPKKSFICFLCKEEIDPKEPHCDIVSNAQGKVTNTDSFHAKCWREWLQGLVRKGLQNAFSQSMDLVKKVAQDAQNG